VATFVLVGAQLGRLAAAAAAVRPKEHADLQRSLLLGLKGTMSEAELHLQRSRLRGAKRVCIYSTLPPA
jgi:hypothetical protein